jgi:hypothetical protein
VASAVQFACCFACRVVFGVSIDRLLTNYWDYFRSKEVEVL